MNTRHNGSKPVESVRQIMITKLVKDRSNIFYRCVEDSSEAIMITNLKGILAYVNPAWCEIYGYTEEQAIGNSPKLLHSGHHKLEFYKNMWAEITNPDIGFWKGEVFNRSSAGKIIPVLLTITPFKNDEGKTEGYMGIAVNLLQRKQLEAQVMHQDRLASIGMLASGLAHEIGTPLGVIRGRAEMLQMNAKNETEAKSLDIIVTQIDRISKLIRSLLKVSRGTSDLKIEEISLKSVIEEVHTLLEKDMRNDSITFTNEVAENLYASADYNRVEQIFLNITMNAIHALHKKESYNRQIQFKAIQAGKKVVVKVIDNGCGISKENIKKLFQPFFTTKDIGEGTGLGLAIVAQLVHEMGGEISVESELDQGATFTVILPGI